MNEKQMIEAIWAEYHHAWSMVKDFKYNTTWLQASGHAQCALSLLARFGEETSKQHDDMAKAMQFVVNQVGFIGME